MDLPPEHEVFLSHSGSQKPFVRALYKDLKKRFVYAFFDESSLPLGEPFPKRILEAARQCRVAVVVLSEEFLSTKWPILELTTFLEAKQSRNRSMKIVPLFFKVSPADLTNEGNQRKRLDAWQKADSRSPPPKCKDALKELRSINGVEFKEQGLSEEKDGATAVAAAEKQYREMVVRRIYEICPPNLWYDDSRIRGKDRLCEVIVSKFEGAQPENGAAPLARVVGVYGMGGTGKTTLCKMLSNRFFKKFPGKVFHLELDSFGNDGKEKMMERLKIILGKLSDETAPLVQILTDPDQVLGK